MEATVRIPDVPGPLLQVISIATAAIVITAAQTHPSILAVRELMRSPITFRSLLSITTRTTSGGANTPFTAADQNNIFTALSPAKTIVMASAITA